MYDRLFDTESETPHPIAAELWVTKFLLSCFSGDDKIPIFFPSEPYTDSTMVVRLLACAKYGKAQATWKEILIYRHREVMQIFNLISHGRRLYRAIAFTSNSKFCLHSFPANLAPRKKDLPLELRESAGSTKLLRVNEKTLVITRKNEEIGGLETYLPPRLLQGVLPTVLLEAFRLWQGEDGVIRGEPLDDTNLWFSYNVEIKLEEKDGEWGARVIRRPQGARHRKIKDAKMKLAEVVRGGSDENKPQITDSMIEQLTALGFGVSSAKLALKKSGTDIQAAAQWLLDDENQMEVSQMAFAFCP